MVAAQNAIDGHEVFVIASTLNCKDGLFFYDTPIHYVNTYGVDVDIIPYSRYIPEKINHYIRKYQGLRRKIEIISPDIIVVHGAQSVDLATVRNYVKSHKNVNLVIDTHAAYYNSASNYISKEVLHKIIYKHQIKRCEKYVKAFFAIGIPEKKFFHDMYNVSEDKISILRLPGKLEDEKRIIEKSVKIRNEMGINNEIVLMHSGRMNKMKGTDVLVHTFDRINPNNCYLILAGRLSDDIKDDVLTVINRNKRIIYLGWISSQTLEDYLCMADYYIQHQDVTATVQQAMCKGCGMILSNKVEEYRAYINGNGFLVNDEEDLKSAIEMINDGRVDFCAQKQASVVLSNSLFDIKKISKALILE